ncbi:MAG: VWA domain-containing protein [Blastocatellia bacterium]|nr:VWA domain-containing protein [Blastocatellia bacterium]
MNKLVLIAASVAVFSLTAVSGYFGVAAQNEVRDRSVQTLAPPTPTPPVFDDDDDQVIRVDTELVNLNVRVLDRNGRPVNNLRQADFTIYEDGVSQPIEFFSQSEVPTNYSLVIDNSGSLRSQLEKVIEASKVILDTNRPLDQTSVIRFISSQKITVEQPFTSDKEDLYYALDNLYVEGGQTAIRDAVYLAAQQVDEHQRKGRDDRTRRAIVLVTDGEDRDSYYSEQQLFELLRESDVQIYAIGFINELSSSGGFIRRSEQARAKAFLDRLVAETGGKAYYPASAAELPRIGAEIANEMRTQYSIGYVPTNERTDGSYRSIRVLVPDGPNKEKRVVVTRTGRTAEPTGAAPRLQQ